MVDYLTGHGRVNPERICFDHCEEHTIHMVREAGFWSAMTIYPVTKNTPARVVDAIEQYGLDRMLVDASGDWGPSDPGTLHDAIIEMRRRGHSDRYLEVFFYNNPCFFLGQNPKFKPQPTMNRSTAWTASRR